MSVLQNKASGEVLVSNMTFRYPDKIGMVLLAQENVTFLRCLFWDFGVINIRAGQNYLYCLFLGNQPQSVRALADPSEQG